MTACCDLPSKLVSFTGNSNSYGQTNLVIVCPGTAEENTRVSQQSVHYSLSGDQNFITALYNASYCECMPVAGPNPRL